MVLRERTYRTLPGRQCLRASIRFAVPSGLPTTFGTTHLNARFNGLALVIAKVWGTSGAGL